SSSTRHRVPPAGDLLSRLSVPAISALAVPCTQAPQRQRRHQQRHQDRERHHPETDRREPLRGMLAGLGREGKHGTAHRRRPLLSIMIVRPGSRSGPPTGRGPPLVSHVRGVSRPWARTHLPPAHCSVAKRSSSTLRTCPPISVAPACVGCTPSALIPG